MDLRYALRTFARTPGFTLVIVLTLALGIGSTTTLFSVVYGVLLRPLPYPAPEQVVKVWHVESSGVRGSFSPADFLDLARDTRSLAAVGATMSTARTLTGAGEPVRLATTEVTRDFFRVLGVPAARGRTFDRTDARGSTPVVLTDGAWREQFGGDPAVVGRTIRLDGQPSTVIGIMPRGFAYPEDTRLWQLAPQEVPTPPLTVPGELITQRDVNYMDVIARVRPGVTVAQADEEVTSVSRAVAERFPETNRGETFRVEPLHAQMVDGVRTGLLVLFGAVASVLLIAGANVAGLLLARAAARRRELAVRTALGASRARLVRQLLVESVMLALAGGAIGLLAAVWGVDLVKAYLPDAVPRAEAISLDPAVAAFGVMVALLVGLLFGTAPAWLGSSVDLGEALKAGGRSATAGGHWSRRALVVAQVAVALVLLAGAGLMIATLLRLDRVDPGFRSDGVAMMQVVLPQSVYDKAGQTRFYEGVLDTLAHDGRVVAAATVFPIPLVNNGASAGFQVEGDAPLPDAQQPLTRIAGISPDYFRVMRIPLLGGRVFARSDMRERAGVCIISRAFAERYFHGRDPLGLQVRLGDGPGEQMRVVGVVGDIRAEGLEKAPDPLLYFTANDLMLPFLRVVVRTDRSVEAASAALGEAVRRQSPDLPLERVETLETVVARASAQPRFRAWLVGAFAAAALLLAALGLYGLISYSVTERVREFGVRLALGATPREVLAMVLREGLGLTLAGLVLGLAGAIAAARVVASLLYETSATDPLTLGSVAGVLALTAVAACSLPARRAMRVDPIVALRVE